MLDIKSLFEFNQDPVEEIAKITESFEKMAIKLDSARQKYLTRKDEINAKITDLSKESSGLDSAIDQCETIAENLRKIVKP